MSGRGLPRKARMVLFLWDRHSKLVNTQEPLFCVYNLVNVRKLQSGLLKSSGYSEHKYFG